MSEDDEFVEPRFASRGRAYVYVLPCRDEDVLKVGFSRDPLRRLQTLHARFFDFFDLDRALLIGTDHVRDARRIERRFIETFAGQRSPAPLVVPDAAAGHTEWYRGVYPDTCAMAREIARNEGWALHAPLRAWLREVFADRSALLFAWSAKMLEVIEYERFNATDASAASSVEPALLDALDAFESLGIATDALVPENVLAWYRTR